MWQNLVFQSIHMHIIHWFLLFLLFGIYKIKESRHISHPWFSETYNEQHPSCYALLCWISLNGPGLGKKLCCITDAATCHQSVLSKSSSGLCLSVHLFLVVWCYCCDVWTAECRASLPQYLLILLCPVLMCVHKTYPDLYVWPAPLGLARGREPGCMSVSRWGPRSSHEWGPQLANSVILVICLIVFRTKKEISCDWWVSNVEGIQLSVSPKWQMPLWSLNASVHTLGLCSTNCACCLYVQYCLALGQKRSC